MHEAGRGKTRPRKPPYQQKALSHPFTREPVSVSKLSWASIFTSFPLETLNPSPFFLLDGEVRTFGEHTMFSLLPAPLGSFS